MFARITSSPNDLTIVYPSERSLLRRIVLLAGGTFFVWQWARFAGAGWKSFLVGLLQELPSLHHFDVSRVVSLFLAMTLAVVVFTVLREVFGSHEIWRCTPSNIAITWVDFGCAWHTRHVLANQVIAVSFGVVTSTRHGVIYGLTVEQQRRSLRSMPELAARDAEAILNGLQGLGYPVVFPAALAERLAAEGDARPSWWRW